MNQARQGSVRSPQAISCRCSAAKKINEICRRQAGRSPCPGAPCQDKSWPTKLRFAGYINARTALNRRSFGVGIELWIDCDA
jgi:hypothetical protein